MPATATRRRAAYSPRKRFWLASVSAPLPAIAAAHLMPITAIPVLAACWLLALHWVLVTHSPSGRLADVSFSRLLLVTLGLSTAIVISGAIAAVASTGLALHGRFLAASNSFMPYTPTVRPLALPARFASVRANTSFKPNPLSDIA